MSDAAALFDSHCHLQMSAFARELSAVLERARASGVAWGVIIGMDLANSQQAVALAAANEGLYATVGVHPHDAKHLDSGALQPLREMAAKREVVAIGETGLDFYRNLSPRADQERAFKQQLALAAELDMPVVIHARQSQRETFDILRDWAGDQRREKPLGVMHCFTGDRQLAEEYTRLGFMISMAGNVTYPNAGELQAIAASVPLESLVVETDCPFLPPQTHRGQRCEPSYLTETAHFIAGLRRQTFDVVAATTTANARRLYRLEDRGS